MGGLGAASCDFFFPLLFPFFFVRDKKTQVKFLLPSCDVLWLPVGSSFWSLHLIFYVPFCLYFFWAGIIPTIVYTRKGVRAGSFIFKHFSFSHVDILLAEAVRVTALTCTRNTRILSRVYSTWELSCRCKRSFFFFKNSWYLSWRFQEKKVLFHVLCYWWAEWFAIPHVRSFFSV